MPVAVDVGLADHLVHLLIGQLLAEVRHHMAQFSGGDESVSISVEDLEGFDEFFLGVGVLHLPGHQGQELGEVDGAVAVGIDLVDHILQFGLSGVLAQGSHDCSQFLRKASLTLVVMEPSPFLSNSAKASLNSAICSSLSWSAISRKKFKYYS